MGSPGRLRGVKTTVETRKNTNMAMFPVAGRTKPPTGAGSQFPINPRTMNRANGFISAIQRGYSVFPLQTTRPNQIDPTISVNRNAPKSGNNRRLNCVTTPSRSTSETWACCFCNCIDVPRKAKQPWAAAPTTSM